VVHEWTATAEVRERAAAVPGLSGSSATVRGSRLDDRSATGKRDAARLDCPPNRVAALDANLKPVPSRQSGRRDQRAQAAGIDEADSSQIKRDRRDLTPLDDSSQGVAERPSAAHVDLADRPDGRRVANLLRQYREPLRSRY
jgi:hypothetical protein